MGEGGGRRFQVTNDLDLAQGHDAKEGDREIGFGFAEELRGKIPPYM